MRSTELVEVGPAELGVFVEDGSSRDSLPSRVHEPFVGYERPREHSSGVMEKLVIQ